MNDRGHDAADILYRVYRCSTKQLCPVEVRCVYPMRWYTCGPTLTILRLRYIYRIWRVLRRIWVSTLRVSLQVDISRFYY